MTLPNYFEQLNGRLDLLKLQAGQRSEHSFVHHNPDRARLDVHYYFDPIAKDLVGGVFFGAYAEGPPGCAHGGSIATVMDDGMGTCAWANGHRVVALNLTVNYKKFVPLQTWPTFRFWVEKTEKRAKGGRKVFTRGELRSVEGELHAEASGLFLEIDFMQLLEKESHGPVA